MKYLKKRVIDLFRKNGYDIVKIKPPKSLDDGHASPYEISLLSLLSNLDKMNIVVVGANDGMVGDPIYNFVRMYPHRSRLLLVEPQTELIPFLKKNYSFHPDYHVYNGAIGPDDELKLYSVNKSAWKYVAQKRQKDWPEHRASTGRTSPDREILKRWLKRIVDKHVDVDEMITENVVPCKKLDDVLKEVDFSRGVDVLQIDTEGFDDQIIYNAEIDNLNPSVILFEISLLDNSKLERVKSYLEEKGYFISILGTDALAIRAARK